MIATTSTAPAQMPAMGIPATKSPTAAASAWMTATPSTPLTTLRIVDIDIFVKRSPFTVPTRLVMISRLTL